MYRILIFLLFCCSLIAQHTQGQSVFNLSPGDSLMFDGDLKGAIKAYRVAYGKDSKNIYTVYNMACAYARLGQNDSAFRYVHEFLSCDTNISTIIATLTDPDFVKLLEDKRWEAVEDKVIAVVQKKMNNPYKDIPLTKRLLRMRALDQAYYSDLKIAEAKTGRGSSVVVALWDLKRKINDKNLKDMEQIITEKGWPKISQVGQRAADAAFLIIQHSDVSYQKKYLPTLLSLCKDKEADWENYALMYDRIQTSENKPQRYGSQVRFNEQMKKYELFPLEDAKKVDEWRKEAGLGPLAEYVSRWDITWPPGK